MFTIVDWKIDFFTNICCSHAERRFNHEEMLHMEGAIGATTEDLGLTPCYQEPPLFISVVLCFLSDLKALQVLMSGTNPSKMGTVLKSGYGYLQFCRHLGSRIWNHLSGRWQGIFQYGQWPDRISETMSSNWRELANLVDSLEVEVQDQEGLTDCEIILFMDITTTEAAYWKGASKSEWMLDLVLHLRLLEINNDLIIHVIHVGGTCMKVQGTYGISWGG